MGRQMLINADEPEEYRLAIISGKKLEEFYLETTTRENTVGNIYKAVVENIQPSLQAAFVNLGAEKNGFLQLHEIHPDYYQQEPPAEGKRARIQDVLRPGQEIMVQVVKEATPTKGAFLTTYISLPGRYLVLMPGSKHGGISRRIEDEQQRQRLRNIISQLQVPEGIHLIVRLKMAVGVHHFLVKRMTILARDFDHDSFCHFIAGDNTSHTTTIVHFAPSTAARSTSRRIVSMRAMLRRRVRI